MRQKNVAMTWIDYKKANDMILHNWLIDCLKMHKIYNKVLIYITESMKNWRVKLIAGGKTLAVIKIQRHYPGRCAFTITICNNNDATQLHT